METCSNLQLGCREVQGPAARVHFPAAPAYTGLIQMQGGFQRAAAFFMKIDTAAVQCKVKVIFMQCIV